MTFPMNVGGAMNIFEFANLHPVVFCFVTLLVLRAIVKVVEYFTLPQCKHCRDLNDMIYEDDEEEEDNE